MAVPAGTALRWLPGNTEARRPGGAGRGQSLTDDIETRAPRAGPLRRYLPLALIAGAAGLGYGFGLQDSLSFSALVESREGLRAFVDRQPVVAVGGFVATYVLSVALSLPGASFLTLAGGLLFGWVVGAAAAVVAATIGAVLLFLAARTALADTLAAKAGPFLSKVSEGFRADAFNYLLFLRLVPLFPFWLVNLAPALLGMRLWPFALATLIGILPGTVAFSIIGSGLDSVIQAQIAANPACAGGAPCKVSIDPKSLVTADLLVGLAALGVVSLIPIALKAWRARRAGRST